MNVRQVAILIVGLILLALLFPFAQKQYDYYSWYDETSSSKNMGYIFMTVVGLATFFGIIAAKDKENKVITNASTSGDNREIDSKIDLEVKLNRLKSLNEEGILTDEEYQYKREEVIKKIDI